MVYFKIAFSSLLNILFIVMNLLVLHWERLTKHNFDFEFSTSLKCIEVG